MLPWWMWAAVTAFWVAFYGAAFWYSRADSVPGMPVWIQYTIDVETTVSISVKHAARPFTQFTVNSTADADSNRHPLEEGVAAALALAAARASKHVHAAVENETERLR